MLEKDLVIGFVRSKGLKAYLRERFRYGATYSYGYFSESPNWHCYLFAIPLLCLPIWIILYGSLLYAGSFFAFIDGKDSADYQRYFAFGYVAEYVGYMAWFFVPRKLSDKWRIKFEPYKSRNTIYVRPTVRKGI